MGTEPQVADRQWNYFNYFTEVEEHFQRARGTGLFLLSPLDWALIETWKDAGVPLEAVLRGIDAAFAKWHASKRKFRSVNSIAYCAQAVAEEAQILSGALPARGTSEVAAPFPLEDLKAYLERNAAGMRSRGAGFAAIADSLERLAGEAEAQYKDLEELERRLTALEEKMSAIARASQSEEALVAARRDLDAMLQPYRGKMTADQLAMLERQYLDKRLLESANLPRLSLFYLR